MEKEIALVYMVAGLSNRFEGKIKQLAQVGPEGETLIECSLNQALPAGFTKIIFIVGEKTETAFKEKFGSIYKGRKVEYVFQGYDKSKRDKPWGTTDAVCSLIGKVNCPFVVCNGDDLYGFDAFKQLVGHLKEDRGCATAGYLLGKVIPENGFVNRGIFVIRDELVKSIKEEVGLSRENLAEKGLNENSLCSMNIFALTPSVLDYLNLILDRFKEEFRDDRNIECYLPEQLGRLIQRGMIRIAIYPTDEIWIGITNPEDEESVRNFLAKKE